MTSLTVFTPTYNRAHTLGRTYESLCRQTCMDFEWLVIDDGSTDGTPALVRGFIEQRRIPVRYIRKENGGLYTGYNTAYANISAPLAVCVDSDDFMPPTAVELILATWHERGGERYCGIVGLDYSAADGKPIGGRFPEGLTECFYHDLHTHNLHRGDAKQVMRTDLMRQVAPQEGFPGEKNFNPFYMILQVMDKYPTLILNENLCWVDYQTADSMSRNILHQYIDSPRSFAKTRILEMQLTHNTLRSRARSAVHYVAECLIARDSLWLRRTTCKALTILATPPGLLLYLYIRWKTREQSPRH